MKAELIDYLKCLKCGSNELTLTEEEKNGCEIRTGFVSCGQCGNTYRIQDGIVDFLYEPSDTVVAEISGTEKLMNNKEFDPEKHERKLLRLPDFDSDDTSEFGHLTAVRANFVEMLDRLDLKGKTVLDIGAGQCWTSHNYARSGAKVIASDIVRSKYKGLKTADVFFRDGLYFERVLADMNRLPLRENSVDIVAFNNVLHHSSFIDSVISDCYALLKPGGELILIGEPSSGLFTKDDEFGKEEREEFDINENIYKYGKYKKAINNAGFKKVSYFFPPSIDIKLKTGMFGWKRVNKAAFRFIHFFWKFRLVRAILKGLLFRPAALLYTFQMHCIAEKRNN